MSKIVVELKTKVVMILKQLFGDYFCEYCLFRE